MSFPCEVFPSIREASYELVLLFQQEEVSLKNLLISMNVSSWLIWVMAGKFSAFQQKLGARLKICGLDYAAYVNI